MQKEKIRYIILFTLIVFAITTVVYFGLSYIYPKKEENNTPITTSNGKNSQSISSSKDTPEGTVSNISTAIKPIEPSGNFVSNHRPNLSGSPAPNSINSVCVTTPGVDCVMKFTNGTVTKQLEAKKTDGNGLASWDWKLQDVGLTEGSWKVTAVATNGALSSEATDAMNLEVKP